MSNKKSGRGLTGRVRASITSYIRDEVRRRPHCCVTWNLYGTPEGTLVVSYMCLNHDAVWKDVFNVTLATTKTDLGPSLDSRCSAFREIHAQEATARPAEAQEKEVSTADLFDEQVEELEQGGPDEGTTR